MPAAQRASVSVHVSAYVYMFASNLLKNTKRTGERTTSTLVKLSAEPALSSRRSEK